MKKRKLRQKIASKVLDIMTDMDFCPGDKDRIVNTILSKEDRYEIIAHCDIDCKKTDCKIYQVLKEFKKIEDIEVKA